ncbi:hypothetical protein KIF59_00190 [Enterobacter cloacae subsp. cloacae]|nr:hypothetical protein [Enterobacter cloacae subsp. cloacae]
MTQHSRRGQYLIDWCKLRGEAVTVASEDWHPANHGSLPASTALNPSAGSELDGLAQTFWPDLRAANGGRRATSAAESESHRRGVS